MKIQRTILLLALLVGLQPLSADDFPEKTELNFGFIRLTDCATLVVAVERGYFADEFIDVQIQSQSNWRVLLDRVISGELDGAHMLAGQPLGAAVGVGSDAEIVTAFSMNLSGNAITVSNDVWEKMQAHNPELQQDKPPHPISASALKPVVDDTSDFRMGMVYPVSTHNYELRYWLAAGGINPGLYSTPSGSGNQGGDLQISVTPPPQMPATLSQGTIHGYCVGEPWNQLAVQNGIGVPVVTGYQIWNNNPEKVFGVTKEWAEENPNTHLAVVRALIRAAKWLDESEENRREAVRMLARRQYIGADEKVLEAAMVGTFEFAPGDVREMPDHMVFHRYDANYPFYSDAIWFLTQMRRWGQIAEPKPDEWYIDVAKQVYRPEIYREAVKTLIEQGHLEPDFLPDTDGFKDPDDNFIDGVEYDGRYPNAYLEKFSIGNRN
ncbi:MAG: ABC transporter substrate-binding protein [Opitutales bacterium]|nr:ABC transporter substrate-binding protein [Opitutales bacterium]